MLVLDGQPHAVLDGLLEGGDGVRRRDVEGGGGARGLDEKLHGVVRVVCVLYEDGSPNTAEAEENVRGVQFTHCTPVN